jgi:hypothetical protein
VIVIQDTDDSEDSDVPIRVVRRNARAKARDVEEESFDEESFVEVSDDSPAPRGRAAKGTDKKNGASRRNGVRPAYGLVRHVADADYDSDEDTAELRAHALYCVKCQSSAAHLLVEEARKAQKKKGRRKKNDDEYDAEEDEDRAIKKGGLVQWYIL